MKKTPHAALIAVLIHLLSLATLHAAGPAQGVWNFNGNLNADYGSGPALSAFGFTPSYDNNSVLDLPALASNQRLQIANSTGANGGGNANSTNRWTVVMDVRFSGTLSPFQSLIQTAGSNNNDIDVFVRPDGSIDFGPILSDAGSIVPNRWYRLAFTCGNRANNGPLRCRAYIDGVRTTRNGSAVETTETFNGAFSLGTIFNLFSDDNGHTAPLDCDSVAFWGEELTAEDIAAMGARQPGGIPLQVTLVESQNDTGTGSLRAAIADSPAGGMVAFDTFFSGRTFSLDSQLEIDKALMIDASSLLSGVIIDGGSNDDHVNDAGETRCFFITDGNKNNDLPVTLSNLTIRNGFADGDSEGSGTGANIHSRENLTLNNCRILGGRSSDFGGGIYNVDGSLTMDSCTVSGNSASSASGGGIYSLNGNLTMDACIVTGNRSNGGGGIYSINGIMTMVSSTVSGNSSSQGSGGGILSFGSLVLDSSTVSGNSTIGSSAHGGGIWSHTESGQTSALIRCTISGNSSAAGFGGGFYSNAGQTRFVQCSVTGNSALSGSGGGIASRGSSGVDTEIASTIVRDNSGGDVQFVDGGSNTFESFNGNLIGSGNALGEFSGEVNIGAPILLAPLGSYGGPTQTMPPLPGSPVINMAFTSRTTSSDQRGIPGTDNLPDIGAAEAQAFVLVTTSQDQDNGTTGGTSLREGIDAAEAIDAPGTIITFDSSLSGATINLKNGSTTLNDLTITKALAIDATQLASGITIDGGSNGDFVKDAGETRCFLITDGDDNNDLPVTFTNLTVQNGVFEGDDAGANIHNRENLTLNHCAILNGRAFGFDADGGGIYSESGSLTMDSCSVTGNSSSGDVAGGGGIFSYTNLTNQTSQLVRCTIAGNSSASGVGGGYHNDIGLSQLIHCTVSGNTAPGENGGGIASGGATDIRTELTGTLVRDNPGGDVAFVGLSTNSFESDGNNLVGTGNATGAFSGTEVSTAPILLAPLGWYGGPVRTMHPLAGSPVIDSASASAAGFKDGRGFAPLVGTSADIGAVEVGPITLVTTATDTSLREAIAAAEPLGGVVRFDDALFNGQPADTITLTEGQLEIAKSIFIDASDITGGVTIHADTNSRVMEIFAASPVTHQAALHSLTLTGGSPSSPGGGILNHGNASIIRCTIADNNCFGNGAGIFNEGEMAVNASTFQGNTARFVGGGLQNLGSSAVVTVVNSTFHNNTSNAGGGGGFNNTGGGTATISQCTMVGNHAPVGAGGGIRRVSGSVTLTNSIVTGNDANSLDNLSGTITQTGDNLTTGDALLAPLANYGGLTQTMPPLPGSAAIDMAGSTDPGGTDQRGLPRFAGIALDIGAVEIQGTGDTGTIFATIWLLDTDGDGSPFGVEQALGTDSGTSDLGNSRNPILMGDENGKPKLTFGLAAAALPGTVWRVTRSPDLSNFTEIFRYDGSTSIPAAPDANVTFSIGTTSISVTDLMPPSGKAFYRFEAISPQ